MNNTLKYFETIGLKSPYNGGLNLITGTHGSGKTSAIINLIQYLEEHQRAVIISPVQTTNSFLSTLVHYIHKTNSVFFEIIKLEHNIIILKNKKNSIIKFIHTNNFHDCLKLAEENKRLNFTNYTFILEDFEYIDQDSLINWQRFNIIKRFLLIEKISNKRKVISHSYDYLNQRIHITNSIVESLRVFAQTNEVQVVFTSQSQRSANTIYNTPRALMTNVNNVIAVNRRQIMDKTTIALTVLKNRY